MYIYTPAYAHSESSNHFSVHVDATPSNRFLVGSLLALVQVCIHMHAHMRAEYNSHLFMYVAATPSNSFLVGSFLPHTSLSHRHFVVQGKTDTVQVLFSLVRVLLIHTYNLCPTSIARCKYNSVPLMYMYVYIFVPTHSYIHKNFTIASATLFVQCGGLHYSYINTYIHTSVHLSGYVLPALG
jgi:hypothetical protein